MTKLHPTNLFAIEVPMDAKQIIICPTHDGLINSIHWTVDNILFSKQIDFNLKILGEVTKDETSFDVETYVESVENPYYVDQYDGLYLYKCYKNYFSDSVFLDENESFYSLLQSNGLEFKEGFKHVILKPI